MRKHECLTILLLGIIACMTILNVKFPSEAASSETLKFNRCAEMAVQYRASEFGDFPIHAIAVSLQSEIIGGQQKSGVYVMLMNYVSYSVIHLDERCTRALGVYDKGLTGGHFLSGEEAQKK